MERKLPQRGYQFDINGKPIEAGDKNLWLAANGVALLGDSLLMTGQASLLVDRMGRDLLVPPPSGSSLGLGLASQGAPVSKKGAAGFWYSLAGLALEGLAKRGDAPGARDLAWKVFQSQTLATHAQIYPDVWYGVWSGPDMYNTPLDANPQTDVGKTWCLGVPQLCMLDVPVTNMFAHSEPLLGSVRMAGLWADARGLIIDPAFPLGPFEWRSRAFSVARAQSEMRGHVRATGDDTLSMRIRVRQVTSPAALAVSVNGRPTSFTYDPDTSFVQFSLPVAPDVEATWSAQTGG